MKKSIFVLIIILCCFNFCRRNVLKVDQEYIGQWSEDANVTRVSCRVRVVITKDGKARSDSKSGSSDCTYFLSSNDGKAMPDGKTLRIGIRKFKIIEKPTQIDTLKVKTDFGEGNSVWRMQLDSYVLYKLIK